MYQQKYTKLFRAVHWVSKFNFLFFILTMPIIMLSALFFSMRNLPNISSPVFLSWLVFICTHAVFGVLCRLGSTVCHPAKIAAKKIDDFLARVRSQRKSAPDSEAPAYDLLADFVLLRTEAYESNTDHDIQPVSKTILTTDFLDYFLNAIPTSEQALEFKQESAHALRHHLPRYEKTLSETKLAILPHFWIMDSWEKPELFEEKLNALCAPKRLYAVIYSKIKTTDNLIAKIVVEVARSLGSSFNTTSKMEKAVKISLFANCYVVSAALHSGYIIKASELQQICRALEKMGDKHAPSVARLVLSMYKTLTSTNQIDHAQFMAWAQKQSSLSNIEVAQLEERYREIQMNEKTQRLPVASESKMEEPVSVQSAQPDAQFFSELTHYFTPQHMDNLALSTVDNNTMTSLQNNLLFIAEHRSHLAMDDLIEFKLMFGANIPQLYGYLKSQNSYSSEMRENTKEKINTIMSTLSRLSASYRRKIESIMEKSIAIQARHLEAKEKSLYAQQ